MLRSLLLSLLLLALVPGGAVAQGLLIGPDTETAPQAAPETTAPDATAPDAGTVVQQAVEGLRSSPVYVHPDAEAEVSAAEAERIARRIDEAGAGPTFIAVVPDSALASAGGDPTGVLRAIAEGVRQPGAYAIVAGDGFRAGATSGSGFDSGEVPDAATDAFRAHAAEGATAVLLDFVDRLGALRRGGGSDGAGEVDQGSALILLAVLGGGTGLFMLSRSRRRRREEAEHVGELRETARDDLIALGDDVRALDIDVQMPDADPAAKEHYGLAVERYQEAERRLDLARSPEDFRPIGEALEQGRYDMAAAKAGLEGRPLPERRAPCFFDPRHGPSTRDVLWAPDGYEPRPVPVCEADAIRVEEGVEPAAREVVAAGQRMPYYAAPGYFGPYAGGFFGGFGGFLPGLVFGSMLGGAMFPGSAWGGGFGDGHDGGGFGGMGGDFGGGGFGGGDFGGGGDF